MKKGYSLIAVVVFLTSCVLTKPTVKVAPYSEDLSKYRPQYTEMEIAWDNGTAEENDSLRNVSTEPMDVTSEIEQLITDISEKNKEVSYISGYTIQVYSGTSKAKADIAKSEIYKLIPESRPRQDWEAPNYKVTVGTFFERIEAYKLYATLKQQFPMATLVPTNIPNQ
ncbi:hypothetical protein QQ008_10660 [Fulvivirgaceae bacterium BMA10]|uniref:SPOR domain-containing protein n=1 Tax=Splendidivirga corallicola TaxID=3051826 RepID=A0ABT8KM74_9BACT|nr:hypothetical protein [Fulvivirgaceae bacterium BMA10]